jgi:excisionase family DNA binding protein
MNTLMTVRETAQYLKLNQMTVYKLAQQGKIPSSKVGGNWRFKKDVLDRWLFDQSRTGRGTCLVVDDDDAICDLLTEIVSDNGFNLTCVGNGEEALDMIEKRKTLTRGEYSAQPPRPSYAPAWFDSVLDSAHANPTRRARARRGKFRSARPFSRWRRARRNAKRARPARRVFSKPARVLSAAQRRNLQGQGRCTRFWFAMA